VERLLGRTAGGSPSRNSSSDPRGCADHPRIGGIPLEGAFASYADRELQPGSVVRPEHRDVSLDFDVVAKRRGRVCFRLPPT
jgi:hypothetical protein